MKRTILATCLAGACAVALSAQTPTQQPPSPNPTGTTGATASQDPSQAGSQRSKGSPVTLSGCLKAGDTAGTFTLTKVKGMPGGTARYNRRDGGGRRDSWRLELVGSRSQLDSVGERRRSEQARWTSDRSDRHAEEWRRERGRHDRRWRGAHGWRHCRRSGGYVRPQREEPERDRGEDDRGELLGVASLDERRHGRTRASPVIHRAGVFMSG